MTRTLFSSLPAGMACLGLLHASQAQVPAHVPTDGLVAWYSLNGNANDLSGQGHDGLVNGPAPTNDRCGAPDGAYLFDGIDDRIELAGTDTFALGAFSISAWARFSGISGALAVVSKHVNFSQNGFGMGVQNDQILFAINNGSATQVGSALQYGDSTWHLLTGTYDGDSMFLYADTVLVASMGGVPAPNANAMNVRIGMDSDLAPFNGSIDDVGLWSLGLTHADVLQLYHACSTAGIAEATASAPILVHPSIITTGGILQLSGRAGVDYEIVTLTGQVVLRGSLTGAPASITITDPGTYIVRPVGTGPVSRLVVF